MKVLYYFRPLFLGLDFSDVVLSSRDSGSFFPFLPCFELDLVSSVSSVDVSLPDPTFWTSGSFGRGRVSFFVSLVFCTFSHWIRSLLIPIYFSLTLNNQWQFGSLNLIYMSCMLSKRDLFFATLFFCSVDGFLWFYNCMPTELFLIKSTNLICGPSFRFFIRSGFLINRQWVFFITLNAVYKDMPQGSVGAYIFRANLPP